MTTGPRAGRVGPIDVGALLAELAMLAGLIYAGSALAPSTMGGVAVAVVLPFAAAVVWGRWLSPRAPRALPPRAALAAKVAIFALAAVLLVIAGPVWLGAIFLVLAEAIIVAAERRHHRVTSG